MSNTRIEKAEAATAKLSEALPTSGYFEEYLSTTTAVLNFSFSSLLCLFGANREVEVLPRKKNLPSPQIKSIFHQLQQNAQHSQSSVLLGRWGKFLLPIHSERGNYYFSVGASEQSSEQRDRSALKYILSIVSRRGFR